MRLRTASLFAFILSGAAALGGAARADALSDRGGYLVNGIVACGNCHTPRGPDGKPIPGRELSGGATINAPVFSAVPSNITPDPETGIGKWTDAQIIDSIRNGRRPDGSIIGPPMPIEFYRGISDADMRAIVAYLRQVKPVSNKTGASTYRIPLPASYGPTVATAPEVSRADKLAYGQYMATALGHCMECHTPEVQGRRDMTRLGAGGPKFGAPGGGVVTAPNITPGNPHGVASWSDEGLKKAIQEGVRPDGGALVRLMAFDYYRNIDAADMDALTAFIRSLRPVQ